MSDILDDIDEDLPDLGPTIWLSAEAFDALLDFIDNPPPPTPELIALMRLTAREETP